MWCRLAKPLVSVMPGVLDRSAAAPSASEPSVHEVLLYDTSLRDGAQRHGLSYSLSDKLKLTRLLDAAGFDYIEGGWPGSNPTDAEYFVKVREFDLRHARIAAFGSTRRVGRSVSGDSQLRALLEANTPVVTLFGKTSPLQVAEILRTSRGENLRLIADSVAFIKAAGREVIFDAEHFFDGFKQDADYALACLQAALTAGADQLVLCDTNGGSLPEWVAEVMAVVCAQARVPIGIHSHNDAELAVANALAAVRAGARHIQGTINGYGERCGNANLIAIVPTLKLKMGVSCNAGAQLAQFTALSRQAAEIANLAPDAFSAYVGSHAFTHKGGVHASAVARNASSYEHIQPAAVGNQNAVVVSELSGISNLIRCGQALGISVNSDDQNLLHLVKTRAANGLHLEAAEGSLELLLRKHCSDYRAPFSLLQFRISSQIDAAANMEMGKQVLPSCQATCKILIGPDVVLSVAEADGPVAAVDAALRSALTRYWPALHELKLSDYRVRILDPEQATGARTRVLIEAAWHEQRWSTVGASVNIIQASIDALVESFELFICRQAARINFFNLPLTNASLINSTSTNALATRGNEHGQSAA